MPAETKSLAECLLAVTVAAKHRITNVNGVASRTFDDPVNHSRTVSLAAGTGLGKADLIYQKEMSLAAVTNEDVDLSGVILDVRGSTILAVTLKGIVVENMNADADNDVVLEVGPGAVNGITTLFTGTTPVMQVQTGVMSNFTRSAGGFGVTPATADILRIRNPHATKVCLLKYTLVLASALV